MGRNTAKYAWGKAASTQHERAVDISYATVHYFVKNRDGIRDQGGQEEF